MLPYLLNRVAALDGTGAALRGGNGSRSSDRSLQRRLIINYSGTAAWPQPTLVTVTVFGGAVVLVGGAPPGVAAAKMVDAAIAKNNEVVRENIMVDICCWGSSWACKIQLKKLV